MIYRTISWFIILFACFYGIGDFPLFDDNEGLYASIARDMLKSGQFIVPHLNGMPYLEKPPLLYWMMAASMSIFGVNEWAVRLVPALMLFMTAFMTQRFITRHTKSQATGFTAALILATSLPLLAMERMILCDMTMTCFFSAALMQFYTWHIENKPRYLLGFWSFLALAVLSKGLVVIILATGTIAIFLWWQHTSFKNCLRILSPKGVLLFLAIAAPWHITASLQEPGFAWFYFINEHLFRFLNMREPHDYYTGPPWYYLPRIICYLVPWTFFLFLLVKRDRSTEQAYLSLKHFLWSWFGFSLLFFSTAGGKANYYMIAGMPALAMLLALRLEYFIAKKSRGPRSLTTGSFALILVIVGFSRFFCGENSGDLYDACQGASWSAIEGVAIYALFAIALCWMIPLRWMAPLLGASVIFIMPSLISGVNLANWRVSQKAVADYLNTTTSGDIAVYQEFEELSALSFYIDKPLIIVDSISNDLLYGSRQPSGKPYFMSLADWAAHSPPVPMIVLKQRLDTVMDKLHKMHVDIRHICVTKRIGRVAILNKCDRDIR